jgi:protein TonB
MNTKANNAGGSLFSLMLAASVLIHIGLAIIFKSNFLKPAEYAVELNDTAMDVAFVEIVEPAPVVREILPEPEEKIEDEPTEIVEIPKEILQETPQIHTEPIQEPPTVREMGAVVQAKPDYLRNPPPKYPRLARERGWEGAVLLRVQVLTDGTAGEVTLSQSSGYKILDDAALFAVKTWKFSPARLGPLAINSWVEIPISFKLVN